MSWEFVVWAIGLVCFLILWEAHIKANPETESWSNWRIFGAWLVFMLWPFLLLYLLLERIRK